MRIRNNILRYIHYGECFDTYKLLIHILLTSIVISLSASIWNWICEIFNEKGNKHKTPLVILKKCKVCTHCSRKKNCINQIALWLHFVKDYSAMCMKISLNWKRISNDVPLAMNGHKKSVAGKNIIFGVRVQ